MSDIIGIKCGGMPHKPRRTLPHLLKHTLIMLMPGPEGGSCRWVCNKLQSRKDGVLRTRDREQARRLHGWSVASQCPHVCRLAAALCFWSDATKDIQVAMLDPASMSKSPCRPIASCKHTMHMHPLLLLTRVEQKSHYLYIQLHLFIPCSWARSNCITPRLFGSCGAN